MLNRYIVIYTRDRRNSGWHGDRRGTGAREIPESAQLARVCGRLACCFGCRPKTFTLQIWTS